MIETRRRLREPQRLLQIFGRVLCRLGLIVDLGQRAAAAGEDHWPGTDICYIYLVGVHVGLGYLGWYQRQLSTSMPLVGDPCGDISCGYVGTR